MAAETKKTTAGALPSISALSGEAEQQKFAEVQRLQQELKDALDYRKGFYLDPTMLAMAQGFAAPTRTGSFFESLGTVAGQLGQAQEAERKRAEEIARMRLELAMGELGLQQQQRMAQEVSQYLGGPTPGVSAVGAATPGAPAGVPAATQPPGAVQPPGVQAAAGKIPTVEDIERARLTNPLRAEVMERQRKAALDAMKVTDKGVTILTPGEGPGFRFEPAPGRPTVPRFLPGTGELGLTEKDAELFDMVTDILSSPRASEDQKKAAQGELNRLVRKARGTDQKKEGPQTPGEAALQAEVEKSRLLNIEKSETERYNTLMNRASGAPMRMAQLQSMRDIASGPNAAKYLAVFEGPKLRDALLKLGEGAGIPEIRDIFINLGLDKNVKAEQLAFQQRMAMVNQDIRRMTRVPGEGAVSDFESRLILATGLDRNDSPLGMVKKIDFLNAKDEFDLNFARALRASKMTHDEFVLNSPQYTSLVNDYYKKLSGIVGAEAVERASSGQAAPAAGPASPLRQRLNLPPR